MKTWNEVALTHQGVPSGGSRTGLGAGNKFIGPQAKATSSEWPASIALIHFSGFSRPRNGCYFRFLKQSPFPPPPAFSLTQV